MLPPKQVCKNKVSAADLRYCDSSAGNGQVYDLPAEVISLSEEEQWAKYLTLFGWLGWLELVMRKRGRRNDELSHQSPRQPQPQAPAIRGTSKSFSTEHPLHTSYSNKNCWAYNVHGSIHPLPFEQAISTHAVACKDCPSSNQNGKIFQNL